MNREEAFKILELSPSSSEDEIKKKFKKLAAKYHPDVNKSDDADDKFKQINEAYSVLQNKVNIPKPKLKFYQRFVAPNISLKVTISFKESVQGCVQNLTYDHFVQCSMCEGSGGDLKDTLCSTCGGQGVKVSRQGPNMFVQTTCPTCHGMRFEMQSCSSCHGRGAVKQSNSIEVRLPGGVKNKGTVSVPEQGNYFFNGLFAGTDHLHLEVTVIPHEKFTLKNRDVEYILDVDLLSVLQGTELNVPTLDEDVKITVPKGSKHLDKITIPGHGVHEKGAKGNQIVILNVKYPEEPLYTNLCEVLSQSSHTLNN